MAAAAAAGTSRQPGAASQVPASPVPQRPRSSSIRRGECGRRRKGKAPCARAPRCVAVLAVCLAWPRRSARRLHCRDLGGVDRRVGGARPHQDKVCGAPQVPGATQAPQVRPPGFRIFSPQPRDSGVGRRGCTPLPRWAVLCAGVVLGWPPSRGLPSRSQDGCGSSSVPSPRGPKAGEGPSLPCAISRIETPAGVPWQIVSRALINRRPGRV